MSCGSRGCGRRAPGPAPGVADGETADPVELAQLRRRPAAAGARCGSRPAGSDGGRRSAAPGRAPARSCGRPRSACSGRSSAGSGRRRASSGPWRCTACPPGTPASVAMPAAAGKNWREDLHLDAGRACRPPRPGSGPGRARCGSSGRSGPALKTLMKMPLVPPSSAAPGEGVVDPVGDEEAADPEPLQPASPRSTSARVQPARLRAAEEVRGLGADHDRELAPLDHPPRLRRARRRAGTSRAAGRRSGRRRSPGARCSCRISSSIVSRLVAGVGAHRLDPADRLVLDRLRPPRAARPPSRPARASGNRSAGGCWCRDGPAGEARPAVGVVGAERQAGRGAGCRSRRRCRRGRGRPRRARAPR